MECDYLPMPELKFKNDSSSTKIYLSHQLLKNHVKIIHLKYYSFPRQRQINVPSLHYILDSSPEKLILYNPFAVASVWVLVEVVS